MKHDETHGPVDDRPDRELEALVVEMRRTYNVPPTPPLDAMWKPIERERFGKRPWSLRHARIGWWMGMAAALILGVGIGRLTRPGARAVAAANHVPSAESGSRTTVSEIGRAHV
jgi:hypothetical protein